MDRGIPPPASPGAGPGGGATPSATSRAAARSSRNRSSSRTPTGQSARRTGPGKPTNVIAVATSANCNAVVAAPGAVSIVARPDRRTPRPQPSPPPPSGEIGWRRCPATPRRRPPPGSPAPPGPPRWRRSPASPRPGQSGSGRRPGPGGVRATATVASDARGCCPCRLRRISTYCCKPAMEEPAVPVRPIHHRRDRQNPSAHHHPQLIDIAAPRWRPGRDIAAKRPFCHAFPRSALGGSAASGA